MFSGGNTSISTSNQDWASFGSYIGGIISPAASILAGYLVYRSFALNAYQQELILARESIARLDLVLEQKLALPFNHASIAENYYGKPLRTIINALSNHELQGNDTTNGAILSLLHNIAITADSIRYYIELLNKHPSSGQNNQWLGELEQAYWIEKYSAVCSRMVKIVGENTVAAKFSEMQLRSFKLILLGGHGL